MFKTENRAYFACRYQLITQLVEVLNDPKFSELSNVDKADILLTLENEGEYDPNLEY